MHFNTHIQIGNHLFEKWNPKMKINMGKNAFVFGNIRPDIIRKGAQDQHIFSKTRHVMTEIIDRLIEKGNRQTTAISEKSILLGSLCHHVSDIFCRYHHDPKLYTDLRSHYQYEIGLHRHFIRLINENKLEQTWNDERYADRKHGNEFMLFYNNFKTNDFIEQLISEVEAYSQEEPGFDLDIRYSIGNCNRVVETFLPIVMKDRDTHSTSACLPETESIFWRDAI